MSDFERAEPLAIGDTTLATVVEGNGPPLVFVHGGVSDLRTWSGQIDTFCDRFRVIAYSRRYCRPNLPIPVDAGDPINIHIEDLLTLMRKLADGPAHVVGHSWGALITLLAAKSAPASFRSLTLIEPHGSQPPVEVSFLLQAPAPLRILRNDVSQRCRLVSSKPACGCV